MDKSKISLDFNSSLFSISFAYCSQFIIYFDKEKSIWSLSYYFRLGRGSKTKYKSMISLDFNSGLFQSHLHIAAWAIYLIYIIVLPILNVKLLNIIYLT